MMPPNDESKPLFLPEQALACVEGFAPLPAVAIKVMEMLVNPEMRTTELESVLQGDVSLVTSVLKLANSAFYGFRRKVDSLGHALVLIGKSEVQALVLSRVMFRALKVSGRQQKALMVRVWKQSLECALAAECIAEQCGIDGPVYFLGGILHDIGRLVVIQKCLQGGEDLQHYGLLLEENNLSGESAFLGYDHGELGAQLLRRWMFPPQLVEMVQEHHNCGGIGFCKRPSQILILADLLSRWIVVRDSGGGDGGQEAALRALLLRCGSDSEIMPDEDTLGMMENAYRQRLEDRAELIELLQM